MKKWIQELKRKWKLLYWKSIQLELIDNPREEVWTKEHGTLNAEAAHDYVARKIEEYNK